MTAPSQSVLEESGVSSWLAEAFSRMPHAGPEDLEGLLVSVGETVVLDGTKASCRCHFIERDGNDRPRVKALAMKLAHQAVNFCIPRSRVIEAGEHYEQTGSTERFSELEDKARKLFARLEKSGEGGELLLYLLLEAVLGVPQLLCKMPLKTNSEMHVHGSDGIHAQLLPGGDLALYWGESKLHKTATSAIDECFKSIAPYLVDEGGEGATERDLLLVRDNLDTGEQEATAALARYFEDSGSDSAKVEFRGACLVGFSLTDDPHPHEDDGETVRAQVTSAIAKWNERIGLRIGDYSLKAFEFEVFCVPMPSVEEFRKAMRKRLGLT